MSGQESVYLSVGEHCDGIGRALSLGDDPDYRVLQRVPKQERQATAEIGGVVDRSRNGLIIDVETTGLDTTSDKIIEIGMLPFTFGADGDTADVSKGYQDFEDPGDPLSDEVKAITGLSDEDLTGESFEDAEIEIMAAEADLIICHNAEFDRKFLERRFLIFESKHFACSCSQIDWKSEGIHSAKLDYILFKLGWFFDDHRALADCEATLHLLGQDLPVSGGKSLSALLETARKPTQRVWALGSPFDAKDALKARGYRWNGGEDGRSKAWYTDINEDDLGIEFAWLDVEVYQPFGKTAVGAGAISKRITGKDRFSIRS